MSGPKKALTSSQKITNLFDKDYNNSKSLIRHHNDLLRPYDPRTSWEARSDDPNRFSKLTATYVAEQDCNPICLSGKVVVQLDEGLGINSALQAGDDPSNANPVPLTIEQTDVGMTSKLKTTIPIVNAARSNNEEVITEERGGFKNQRYRVQTLMKQETPQLVIEAGPQCNQKLLTPAQRREVDDFLIRKQAADAQLRSAAMARERTRRQVTGQQFRRGILMVDSSNFEDSEIYGERAHDTKVKEEYMKMKHIERRAHLSKNVSALHTNGNILVPKSLDPSVKTNKLYQSKGGAQRTLSFDETHNRLFYRQADCAPNTIRAQQVRDQELSGKDYDIVSNTIIENWPSRTFHRGHDRRLDHPSQSTLEGHRNLQGTMTGV
jgi:hypothetical protein